MTPATTPPADDGAADGGSPERAASPAQRAATALVVGLIRHGVRDVVLSPGSRSQALALAVAAAARAGALELHVRVDERVAGFTALGLAAESGLPVPVIAHCLVCPPDHQHKFAALLMLIRFHPLQQGAG